MNSKSNIEGKNGQLKILFIPAWYPSINSPSYCIFMREYARAAAISNEVIILYSEAANSFDSGISNGFEDGIRVIRVKYGGIYAGLRKILGIAKNKTQISKPLARRASSTAKILSYPQEIIANILCYWSILLAFWKLYRNGWKPDIIHAHVYTSGVPAILIGKIYKIPVIITEHFSGILVHTLNRLERMKLRFAMNNANAILPVSQMLGDALKDFYGIKTKTIVVPNTVNVKRFCLVDNRDKQRNKTKILTVCDLIPLKGINYLLEALSQIRESRRGFFLDIVGDGPQRVEYEMLVNQKGLNDFVKFHGMQLRVEDFMKECDFFVSPSLYETFGVVIIEAMACGKPVIATNLGGQKEIISKETGILIPPQNVEALKKAIDYMLDHHGNYSEERIRNRIICNYSYAAVGALLDEIYHSLRPKNKGKT
jgi:glycosyltransferase involved in cell wall biosynthesis